MREASFSNTPQLIAGSVIPMPRNDRVVSAMIAAGMANMATATMWLAEFGSRWVVMIRGALAPADFAAET